jgi:hypothetical protein
MSDPAPSARRFHLSDGIVLVAAAALVLTAERTVYWMWSTFSTWFSDVPSWNPAEVRRMAWSLALAEVSLVLLIPSLLRGADRGRLRRGVPGLLVHAAVATVMAVRLAGWAAQATIEALFRGRPNFYETRWTVEVPDYLRDDLRRDVVVAVLATWLTLAIVGRWNSERAWDDRLGRLLAVVWVCFYLGARLMALLP